MVSFHCLLIVIILFPFALGRDNLNCANTTGFHNWELCCGDDIYFMRDHIEAMDSCDVEPQNATLKFADSAWLAYDCNVRKRLNSSDLTPKSYFNLVLRGRNSSQSLLWKTLTSQNNIYKTSAGEGEYDRIQAIKSYRNEFLKSAEQVCVFGDAESNLGKSGLSKTTLDFKQRFFNTQFAIECNEEMLPHSAYFAGRSDSDSSYQHYMKCKEEFNHTLGVATFERHTYSIFRMCRVIGSRFDRIQAEIRKPSIDFETIARIICPGFWSKWVKNSVVDSILERLNQEFKAENLQNLESLMRNKVEEKINLELSQDERLTNKREVVQAIMVLQIADVFVKTSNNICRFDANKKESVGV